MSSVDGNPSQVIVVFASRYGYTEKIARSLENGLRQTGIEPVCINAKDVQPNLLAKYQLICVGGPTEFLSASRTMKNFLDTLDQSILKGKFGFAFDTKLDSRLAGSAAGHIEKKLKQKGVVMIARPESALGTSNKASVGGFSLKEGEESRFEQIGLQLGKIFLSVIKEGAIPA
jgi:flavodoxin